MTGSGVELDERTQTALLTAQCNEMTEHLIYQRLARAVKEPANSEVLRRIAEDELRHYRFWKQYTSQEVRPNRRKVWWYVFLAKTLGLTFSIKLMEQGEEKAQVVYGRIAEAIPEADGIVHDEDIHEHALIALIDEERLRYVGSMVLGLNDALVELTGALAGLTLAFRNTRVIGMAGLITGIAASMSMAASEYLSTKSEESEQDPLKACLYTGVAYVLTVMLLIFPYFVFQSYYASLALTLAMAVLVILLFTFYISVARDTPFRERFLEMALVSLGVAALSFAIGYVVQEVLGVAL